MKIHLSPKTAIRNVSVVARGFGLVALVVMSHGCGRVASNSNNENSSLNAQLGPEPYDSLDWYFPCPFDDAASPDRLVVPTQTNPRNLILSGVGPFDFVKEYMVRVPVTVHGRVCPWKLVHRDVTFIIDVSGSMADTDPMVPSDPANANSPKTCGRMKALEALLAKMPPNITKFGVATYDSGIENFSSQLFNSKSALYADLLRGSPSGTKIESLICANLTGTMYGVALAKAKEMLLTGDPAATKEIIFLSDGVPNDNQATILATTTDFKTNGITIGGRRQSISIATALLGTDPTSSILMAMASLDTSVTPNVPVFAKAVNAGDLADILGRMIDNNKLQGSTVVASGDTTTLPPTSINVFSMLDSHNQFVTQPFHMALDRGQSNYKVDFGYWDTMQNRSTFAGTLHWLPTLR